MQSRRILCLATAGLLLGAACGGTSTPQTQSCVESCTQVIAAGCDNGPATVADCEQGCRETEAACPSELEAVMVCASETETFTCDSDGWVYPDGCATEQDALYACLNDVPDSCIATCPGVMAAGCPSGPPSLAACEEGCAETRAACPAEFDAVIACGGDDPSFSCGDTNGMVYTVGCETEQDALYACLAG